MIKLWFARLNDDARIPSKRREDAGYDIFLTLEEDYVRLAPHETRLFPTGIASAVEQGYYFQLEERGSTGSRGIARRCGVIDSGYRGEWFVPLTNLNAIPLYIAKPSAKEAVEALTEPHLVHYTDKAVCQAVLLPVPETEVVEIGYDELCSMTSERGGGRLGSSGK